MIKPIELICSCGASIGLEDLSYGKDKIMHRWLDAHKQCTLQAQTIPNTNLRVVKHHNELFILNEIVDFLCDAIDSKINLLTEIKTGLNIPDKEQIIADFKDCINEVNSLKQRIR